MTSPCVNAPDGPCRLVADNGGPDWLAQLVNWLAGTPLRILLIVVGALVVHRLTRRALARAVAEWEQSEQARLAAAVGPASVAGNRLAARRGALVQVTAGAVRAVIGVVAGFLVLDALGVELAPLLASAGVVGIAIGFGAQSLVKDFFSGFFLLVEDQLGVGDVVDLGDASGTVESVTLRRTRLRDVSGTVWHVANGEIRRVANRSQYWARAVVDVAVSPDADVRHATEVIRDVVAHMWEEADWREDGVTEAPEVWGVEQIGLDGVTIRTVVTTAPAKQWSIARELRLRIKEALDRAGIPTARPPFAPREQLRTTNRVEG
jgi:moderate conductance mechanosensitive channel